MKLQEAEAKVVEELAGIYEDSEAGNIAGLAIEHVSGYERKEWLKGKEIELNATQVEELYRVIERLREHEPIQYIMNKAWFYGMELYVDKNVLIPRPETEELVDWIVKDIKASGLDVFHKSPTEADHTKQLKILDVGTGSGCIPLALKKTMPKAEVWGCDISDGALTVARRNGSQLDIRVDFQSLNFLDPEQQRQLPTVNIIVSNPPYVPMRDKEQMRPNVLQFEPHTALFVGNNDPLIFYKALLQFSKHRLYPNGSLYMEIHEDLGEEVKALFDEENFKTEIKKDMQGKNRMVKAFI
jgi:release factor glutamine methyltransferase